MTGIITTLTPFEQAEANSRMHVARMNLCCKVQKLVDTLIEVQKLRNLPEDSLMYDPGVMEIAEEEETRILEQLSLLAEIWEKTEGVSA
jgi:hypothetical protein